MARIAVKLGLPQSRVRIVLGLSNRELVESRLSA